MNSVAKTLLITLNFNLLLNLSDNLTITAFPFTINQNLSQSLFISIFVFIFYFILENLFIRNLKIDKFFKDAFVIFIIFTTPLIIFQIQNINRLYFYLFLIATYLLVQYLEHKPILIHAGLIVVIILLTILPAQNLSNETTTDISEETTDLKPNILTFNFGLDQYLELDYSPTDIENISYSLNPTGRNPYTAVFKIENVSNPNTEDIVLGQFENENLQFKYDYFNFEGTYYVEAYFLGLNNLFEITILSKDEKPKSTFKLEPPEIQVENKFKIEKNFEAVSWMWISGAGDSKVLFLDKASNPRAIISLNRDYSRGPALATLSLHDEKIVFFNDNDYKYYSINYFGNFKIFFDNDLDRQYQYHHDISPSKKANLELILVNDLFQAPFIEDVILEIDTSSNTLVRAIDLKDILSYELPVIDDAAFEVDGGIENETDFDWFHANSIEYDKDRNEIIISGRHQGMIGLNYDTLKLNWFIPHNPEFYEKESSYPIMRASFENYMPPNGQHNLTILDNNIFYFDNQAIPKSFNNDSNYNPYDLKSFLVKLEVDFEKMEILSQELKSYNNVWSKVRGGIDFTDAALSNYLISFGGIYYDEFGARTLSRQTQPKTFEWKVVEFYNENVVREITAKGRGAYRALFFMP